MIDWDAHPLGLVGDSALARLGKDVENRTWPLPARMHGQRIAIHAAAAAPTKAEMHDYVRRTQFQTAHDDWKWHQRSMEAIRGHIVATVIVMELGPDEADRSPWALPGYQHRWALIDMQPMAHPTPCLGAQRFWRVPSTIAMRTVPTCSVVRTLSDGPCPQTPRDV